jgi:hypothetical protein
MTDLKDAARQALEALDAYSWEQVDAARAALKAALEQQEQEPVAWMVYTQDGKSVCVTDNPADFIEWRSFPLFTHPPRREWRGLTDTERAAVQFESFKRGLSPLEFMELHEAKLREKNHE